MRKYFLFLLLGLVVASSSHAAPANDNIDNATVLPSSRKVLMRHETIEGSIDGSVWYLWTAPSYGTVTMQFASGFLTFPTVYNADTFGVVGHSKSASAFVGGLWDTDLTFEAVLGQSYYIYVEQDVFDSNYTSPGFGFLLAQELGDLPDNFSDAATITTSSLRVEGSNLLATTETNEPLHADVSNAKSVWLKWTAPLRSTVSLDTTGSSIDTVLAVYTGSSLTTLTEVDSNDDQSGGFNKVVQSAVGFTAAEGQTYYFAIASKTNVGGRLAVNFTATPRKPDFISEASSVYVKDATTGHIHAAALGTGTITYKWQRKAAGTVAWVDLTDDATYTGTAATTLNITTVSFAMNGDQFRSAATDNVGTSYSKVTKLVITEFAPLAITVGGTTSLDLTNSTPPPVGTTYYAKGLPSGFVLDATTGLITVSGTITPKPGTYAVTYGTTTTDINGKKTNSPPTTVLIVVSPLSADLSGGFETILEDFTTDLPVGKVELLINAKTSIITGKLTTATDAKIYALKGKLALNSSYDTGTAQITVSRGKTSPPYRLDLTLDGTHPGSPQLSASLKQLDASFNVTSTLSDSTSGVQLTTYTALSPTPWQGKYTVVLDDPTTPPVNQGVTTPPEGTGYGVATIPANKGLMTFKGKLGDGTALTASLAPSADGSYRWYVKPYKTGGSFGGWIQFVPVSGSTAPYQVTGTSDSELYWTKSTFTTDKSYRAGFGPMAITATAQLWTAPVSDIPLQTSLKLTNGALGASFTSANLPSADTSLLPTSLTLGSDNKITVTLPSANADKFTAKVNTTTGGFTASLTLSDLRKVTVEGTFLQQPGTVTTGAVIGEGFFTIPPLIKGNENVTGKILFVAP